MRCKIHRGCHEIGGNCVEVEAQGKRIVLDIGLPLKDDKDVTVPDSHPHPHHYGLLEKIIETVPVYMGLPLYDDLQQLCWAIE